MEFKYPFVFLIILIFLICAFTCKVKNATLYMSLFKYNAKFRKKYFLEFFKWLGIISLLFALASPITKTMQENKNPAHSVVLLMDTSKSMVQTQEGFFGRSVHSDKFEKAKKIAASYIKHRQGDNVGLIVFGDFAYVASPLSFDHVSTASLLEHIKQGVAGDKTAMFDALFLSARLLRHSKAKQKAVILLTDGFNTSGKIPLQAALRAVKSENIKVFTIGIGREGEFDAQTLSYIAKQSGGKFFYALHADGLKQVYEKIDKLQKSEVKADEKFITKYWYRYPLFLSILCFFLYIFILKGRRI
jgi:Ca-activated chloride channel homolog